MRIASVWLPASLVVLYCTAAQGDRFTERADALLAGPQLEAARAALSPAERRAIGRALCDSRKNFSEQTLSAVLRNPVAWDAEPRRQLLGTVLRSLPAVVGAKGLEETLALTAKSEPSLMRGHGTEIIAAAALSRYVGEGGERAKVTRISGMIRCADGRKRENDGGVLIGADGIERLVTVKSVSGTNALSGALTKATDQLALRNVRRNGTRRAGVVVVGYDDPAVLEALKRKDWRAAATRTGAKLLVLAVDERTGASVKLAASEPDPNSPVKPKALPPRLRLSQRLHAVVMRTLGKANPKAAARFGRFSGQLRHRWQDFKTQLRPQPAH